MHKKISVSGYPRRKGGKEEVKGYLGNKGQCFDACSNARKNLQGEVICTLYFDLIPRPEYCEYDGKHALLEAL